MVDSSIWPSLVHSSEDRLFHIPKVDLVKTLDLAQEISDRFKEAKEKARETHEGFYSGWKNTYGNRYSEFPEARYAIIFSLGGISQQISNPNHPSGAVFEAEQAYQEFGRTRLRLSDVALLTRTKNGIFLLTQKVKNIGIDPTFLYEVGKKFGEEVPFINDLGYTNFSVYSKQGLDLVNDQDPRVWEKLETIRESRFF